MSESKQVEVVTSMRKVNPEVLAELLTVCFRMGDALMIEGAPGLGKSAIVADTAENFFAKRYADDYEQADLNGRKVWKLRPKRESAFGVHDRNGVLVSQPAPWMQDVRLLLHDPTDVKGMYYIHDGELKCSLPDIIPVAGRVDPRGGVCFMDELPNAPGATQGAALQPVHDRRIGSHIIEDGWVFAAAGNRTSDGTYTNKLSHALGTRFATIVELVCDSQQFTKWGTVTGRIAPQIIAFLRRFPQHVHDFDNKSAHASHPNPRVWEKVSRYIEEPMSALALQGFLAGALGDGTAQQMLAVLKDVEKCPDPDLILINPDSARVPKDNEPSIMYMICSALVPRTTKATIKNVAKYISKLPIEFQVIYFKDVLTANPDLTMTPEFSAWVAEHGNVLT